MGVGLRGRLGFSSTCRGWVLNLEFEFQGRGPRNGGWNEAGR